MKSEVAEQSRYLHTYKCTHKKCMYVGVVGLCTPKLYPEKNIIVLLITIIIVNKQMNT